jgi:hypothetical protein
LGETPDGVLMELPLRGHLGGKPLQWVVVDRIVLEDGLIRERSYFDPAPLLRAVAMRLPYASLPLLLSPLRRRGLARQAQ